MQTQQECIPVGCVPSSAVAIPSRGVSASGVSAWGRLPMGMVSAWGECLPRGMCTSPHGQTDACENIIFPQLLLRTVKMADTCILQEHQTIPTTATVSKDSDKISISVIMAVYEIIFQVNLRNQEIVYQHNITEKYYRIGRSELRSDI